MFYTPVSQTTFNFYKNLKSQTIQENKRNVIARIRQIKTNLDLAESAE